MLRRKNLLATVPLLLAAAAISVPAHADPYGTAQERVDRAVRVVNLVKEDPNLAQLLSEARGVFIVPHFGKAAFIVGGQGGPGVVLVKKDGRWSDPAFYNIGGGSIGFQAGGSGGSVVMMLMTRRAVDQFENNNGKWSLHAGAGLTIATYTGNADITSHSDVIVWSDAKGLYGGLAAGVTDIAPDNHLNRDYYHTDATPSVILTGMVNNHQAHELRDALATQVAIR